MKTLYELCKPRDSVFDESKRDDVLDITDLLDNRINPREFFEENFITQGMDLLFDTTFKRFQGQSSHGIIRLKQSMGGGKTHNMISIGLLAKHPEIRDKVLNRNIKGLYPGKARLVGFTGRESNIPFGIWGSIADQLGKKDFFSDFYSPLSAPGQSDWLRLLRGDPLLILIDELPPYLEYATSKPIGNSDLSKVTCTALANLLTAIAKEELSNVLLIISDLRATYERGGEMIQQVFRDLDDEISRYSLNIEPVGITGDEVYHILRKRLFENLPLGQDVIDIANSYKRSVEEAKQMEYTNLLPERIFIGIKDSYPFHPSIKDLFARFKENPGFQQTRGLIRLMRLIVADLWSGEDPQAKHKFLLNAFDINLNNTNILSVITQIKPALAPAIANDIASFGKSIAEMIDKSYNQTLMQDLAKLILVSSLPNVPNALIGLSLQEALGYLAEPLKDITNAKKTLDEFSIRAWYLHPEKDNKLCFREVKNIIAEINDLVSSYDNESAKKELRTFLAEKFKPLRNDCYQNVLVFPAIDEIKLYEDKVTLVLYEPYIEGDLHPDLKKFYENELYKNRVMFLSGLRNTMENLLECAKKFKAIQKIFINLKEKNISESDSQYKNAEDYLHKFNLNLLQSARETFITLTFPTSIGLSKADFTMEFKDNKYNGEEQIIAILLEKQKFTTDITDDTFRKKCEERLFTRSEILWSEIRQRAANEKNWQWHIPSALDALKNDMLKKDMWREHGGYIEKGPFEKESTDLQIFEIAKNDETGETTLKLVPKYGDKVYYDTNPNVNETSIPVSDLSEFRTLELKLYFICIDITNEHKTGECVEWKNKILLKYRPFTKNSEKYVELISIPKAKVKYTLDGSNPKEYGKLYDKEIAIPKGSKFLLAFAEEEGVISDILQIDVTITKGIEINPLKPLEITKNKIIATTATSETYRAMDILKNCNSIISNIRMTLYKTDESNRQKGWIEFNSGDLRLNISGLGKIIEQIRENFLEEGKVTVQLECKSIYFEKGQDFLDWISENKKNLEEFNQEDIKQ